MISDQIGIDLLRTYVAVCRQGSLSRVAAQIGRTQSSLSMQMRRLEGLLQRHLFQRTGRGVVPTAEGELFLGYATRILALGDEAGARLQQAGIGGGCVSASPRRSRWRRCRQRSGGFIAPIPISALTRRSSTASRWDGFGVRMRWTS
ncbi:LysR family transcriptional regulator [Mesorhizobium sp. M4B.F.Ca.ET.089.01.1.1]|uniref:LysR family transcriptional regulator n=1 Tax=Mesorhizobium sp. M4B.F.Ca.ET.089.01.1.1 TaxID=2496662 RepID=UPI001FE179E5|nr:LysR family transcriptional regulator [Mesorhizobium sp. M4B.F.Ca.ET.089.01.1.1]